MNWLDCDNIYTGWANENVTLYFCPYFRHLITDFQNFFAGTLCGQFAITLLLLLLLLYIPPRRKFVSVLPCKISMKYANITTITNKHFGKIEKTFLTNIAVNDPYDTRLCGSNTV